MTFILELCKAIFTTKMRDSLNHITSEMLIFLNANRGGEWTYDQDNDRYEDIKSGRICYPYELRNHSF